MTVILSKTYTALNEPSHNSLKLDPSGKINIDVKLHETQVSRSTVGDVVNVTLLA